METVSAVTLAAFVSGVTSLVKKLGIQGDWLILVCVAAGGFYAFMTTYQPELWDKFVWVWISLSTTGNVALAKDLLSFWKRPFRAKE